MLIHGPRILGTRRRAKQGRQEGGKTSRPAHLGTSQAKGVCVTLASPAVGLLVEVGMKAKGEEVAANSWGQRWRVGMGKALHGLNCVPTPQYL